MSDIVMSRLLVLSLIITFLITPITSTEQVYGAHSDTEIFFQKEYIDITSSAKWTLDENDDPHFVYSKYLHSQMYSSMVYSSRINGKWHREEIPGMYPAFRDFDFGLDEYGNVHVFSLRNSLGNATYCIRNGTVWTSYDMGRMRLQYVDMKVGLNGTVHLICSIYVDEKIENISGMKEYYLMYIKIEETKIYKKIFEDIVDPYKPYFDIDSTGNLHIICTSREDSKPYYVKYEYNEWSINELDLGRTVRSFYGISLDASNTPHIAFQSIKNGSIYFGCSYRSDDDWNTTIFEYDEGNILIEFNIDDLDRTHLLQGSYHHILNGSSWTKEKIDLRGFDLAGDSLMFNSKGKMQLLVFGRTHDYNSPTLLLTEIDDNGKLIADGSVNKEPLVGEDFTLSGSSSYGDRTIVNYIWRSFSSNNTIWGYGEEFTVSVLGPTTHYMVIRIEDSNGNYDEDIVGVHVRDITPPVADAGEDILANVNETVWFDGTGSYDNFSFAVLRWRFVHQGKQMLLFDERPYFTFREPGIYHMELSARDKSYNYAYDSIIVYIIDPESPLDIFFENNTMNITDRLDYSTGHFGPLIENSTVRWRVISPSNTTSMIHGDLNITLSETGKWVVYVEVEDIYGNSNTTSFSIYAETDERISTSEADEELGYQNGFIFICFLSSVSVILFFKLKKNR